MKPFNGASTLAALTLGWWRWIQRNSGPSMSLPGAPKQLDTRLLELGSSVLQGKAPLGALSAYVAGFHHPPGDLADQRETHRYCAQLNEDFVQCVMFDANTPDARLVGVEYLITERLFARLPAGERELWHSHRHDVDAGLLIAPGLPAPAARARMEKLAGMYGKAWCTWDTERDDLPLGIPRPMAPFTAAGQVRCTLLDARSHRGVGGTPPRDRTAPEDRRHGMV
jgi:hypothetical protein